MENKQPLNLIWQADWYGSDQSIVAGDTNFFFLSENLKTFSHIHTEKVQNNHPTYKLHIVSITHQELGSILGILNLGLEYHIHLTNGTVLKVNAEEEPGRVLDSSIQIQSWKFSVIAEVLEVLPYATIASDRENTEEYIREQLLRYAEILNLPESPTII